MKVKNKIILILLLFIGLILLSATNSFCAEYEKPEHIANLPGYEQLSGTFKAENRYYGYVVLQDKLTKGVYYIFSIKPQVSSIMLLIFLKMTCLQELNFLHGLLILDTFLTQILTKSMKLKQMKLPQELWVFLAILVM